MRLRPARHRKRALPRVRLTYRPQRDGAIANPLDPPPPDRLVAGLSPDGCNGAAASKKAGRRNCAPGELPGCAGVSMDYDAPYCWDFWPDPRSVVAISRRMGPTEIAWAGFRADGVVSRALAGCVATGVRRNCWNSHIGNANGNTQLLFSSAQASHKNPESRSCT